MSVGAFTKENRMFVRSLGLGLLCLLMGACASVPMASKELDAQGKGFTTEAGQANVYFVRGWSSKSFLMQVQMDGRIVGSLPAYTYHLVSAAPGRHLVGVQGARNVGQQALDAIAGQNYFFSVDWNAWSGYVSIKQMSDDEGRKAIKAAKRAESQYYP